VTSTMNGVSMTTWRKPHDTARSPVPSARRPAQRSQHRPLIASLTTLALTATLILAPFPVGVEATTTVLPVREAGQPGFIASHRGDKGGAPENTLPALQRAIDGDALFVETDVQLTRDGVPVLLHDWTVDRTTNGTGPVWSYRYDTLATLDAGSWYSPDFADTRVPTLAEFLAIFAPSTKRAIIELKGSWTKEQARIVATQIRAADVDDRVLLASFDLMTLKGLQEVAPTLSRAIVSRTIVGDPAILAAACGAVAIITSHAFAADSPDIVEQIQAAGLVVLLYTLNNPQSWLSATALGVDGIITDRPQQLERWLSEAGNDAIEVESPLR
jgi:glycerophosphoryl diester phosphodiesterase